MPQIEGVGSQLRRVLLETRSGDTRRRDAELSPVDVEHLGEGAVVEGNRSRRARFLLEDLHRLVVFEVLVEFVVSDDRRISVLAVHPIFTHTETDKVVQVVYEEITTSGTFASAQIPFDDTIPQNTEGAELLTATITPRYANSYLYVEAQAFVGENSDYSNGIAMALFRDSTADAFATSFSVAQSSLNSPFGTSIIAIPLRAEKRLNSVAPTPTTIKMRIGLDEVATVRYNGANGSRQFGGSLVSYLKIIEVRA